MLDSSPSCAVPASASAERSTRYYEFRFLLPDPVADQLLDRVRSELPADPNLDPARGDGCQVNSLYFDTLGLDTYHSAKGYRRRKFRLRRHGGDSHVLLERKTKSKGEAKRRCTPVAVDELPMLVEGQPDEQWPGHWYRRQLAKKRLVPACNLSFERVARIGMTPEGPIHFAVDRQIRCRRASGMSLPTLAHGAALPSGQSIVEFKFHIFMPGLLKELIYEFSLTPAGVSKFRLSIEACGLVDATGDLAASQDDTESSRFPLSARG